MSIAQRIKEKQDKDGMLRRALERIIQLYTDKAHFVFELLQNAEDAEAQNIKFVQYDNCLEVYHDGKPFTSANLQSLFDIGMSDKVDNLNQIGEFGVGFKSVFSICETVQIESTPVNFRDSQIGDAEAFGLEIINFIDPKDMSTKPLDKPFTTKFMFPYAAGLPFSGFETVDELRKKLTDKLENLNATTLLFMKNLQSIEYEIHTSVHQSEGSYRLSKVQINEHCVRVRALSDRDEENQSNNDLSYLVFSKETDVFRAKRSIDIAFAFKETENDWEFVPLPNATISVFFPTETESKLKFIVQGPYRTTPNRSSVPFDDSSNIELAKETAQLLYDSVLELKEMGKLNLSFLCILPLKKEDFYFESWVRYKGKYSSVVNSINLFTPIYDSTKKLFLKEDCLPCRNGRYSRAQYVKLVRSKELAEVFNEDDLTSLLMSQNQLYWLPEVLTSSNTEYQELYSYLNKTLSITVISPENLSGYLNANDTFLISRKNDVSWLTKFYNFLASVPALCSQSKNNGQMLTVKFVKTRSNKFIAPYSKDGKNNYTPNIYLPSQIEGLDLEYIDDDIYKNCAHFFKNILLIEKPDEYGYFKARLKARYESGYKVSDEDHIDDVRKILKYINSSDKSEDISQFLNEHFLLRCKKDGKIVYWNSFSEECYFEKSNDNINIKLYFQNLSSKYYADTEFYETNGITYDDLLNLGVEENISHIELSVFSYIANHPDKKDSIVKSQVIFKILGQDVSFYSQWNGQYFNRFGALVKSVLDCGYEWLYSDKMQLVSSKDISKYELNTDIYGKIDYNSDLYNALQFKKNALDIQEDLIKEYAKLSPERKEVFFRQAIEQKFGITLEDLESRLTEGQVEKHFEFPEEKVKNLDLLKSHIKELFCYAAPVKYEYVTRHIRTSSRPSDTRTYLKRMYRDENSGTFACQLCHEGFIDLEMCQIEQKPKFEISPLHVCVCPTCAAKFKRLKNNEKGYAEFYGPLNLITHRALTNEIEKLKFFDGELWFTQVHLAEIIECLSLLKESLRLKQEEFKKSVGKAVKDKKGDVGEIIYVDDACIKVKYKSAEREYKLSMCVENDLLELM